MTELSFRVTRQGFDTWRRGVLFTNLAYFANRKALFDNLVGLVEESEGVAVAPNDLFISYTDWNRLTQFLQSRNEGVNDSMRLAFTTLLAKL